jgi:hypothetical protein
MHLGTHLGLDVSKNTLDAALLELGKSKPQHKVFPNTTAGHEQLLAWLQSKNAPVVHACLEATGTWARTLPWLYIRPGTASAWSLHPLPEGSEERTDYRQSWCNALFDGCWRLSRPVSCH